MTISKYLWSNFAFTQLNESFPNDCWWCFLMFKFFSSVRCLDKTNIFLIITKHFYSITREGIWMGSNRRFGLGFSGVFSVIFLIIPILNIDVWFVCVCELYRMKMQILLFWILYIDISILIWSNIQTGYLSIYLSISVCVCVWLSRGGNLTRILHKTAEISTARIFIPSPDNTGRLSDLVSL